ncbi:MAG: UvrD-helicase domain-containing protein [candidate division Zixibacteria bacterium]|nr:UvrD-helicase domain-containing protein [candidate division Zixibacteria bacterium]
MNRLLDNLNDRQREAVTTTEGPLLVIAGAGSGKTRVLTRRLAHILVERLAEPYQIMAVTFTNKAAGEMKERVSQLMGTGLGQMNVSTFHSFCVRLLRREADRLGYQSNFSIFDRDDSLSLLKNCIKELGFSDTQFPAKGQLRKISEAKNKMLTTESCASTASGYFQTRTAQIYSLYQRRLKQCEAMDFDDLLFNAVYLLQENADLSQKYRDRFRYLMVDEYQDTNHIQYLLLKYLLGEHKNLCVVGDEDQSIYGWRGADIRNILEFEKDYPGARIIKLEQNYRSTQIILDAASAVIQNNEMRKGKALWTSEQGGEKINLLKVDSAEDEAVAIVDRIVAEQNQTGLKEMVVLYRTNAQSRPFEEQLRRRGLPYQIVGSVSFYQRKEIKDLLGYLKLIANPSDDVSFQRVINYPKRGIGKISLAQIAQMARQQNLPSYQIALTVTQYPELAGKQKKLEPFVTLIEKYRERSKTDPIDLLTQDLVTELNLLEELLTEDAVIGQTRVENIEAFIEGAATYARSNGETGLDSYLSEISLFTDIDAYSGIDDKVTMMTLHSAKGLEYATVFIVGLEEGLFPLQRTISEPSELEEERRLFYVGATRARKKLYLATAGSRFRFGEVMSIPSRFIKEIPRELVETTDLRAYRPTGLNRPTTGRPGGHRFPTAPSTTPTPSGVHYEFEADEILQIGRIVAHPTFGRGKILQVSGYGESLQLEIMFTGLGVKKIMAKYAKLKVIG